MTCPERTRTPTQVGRFFPCFSCLPLPQRCSLSNSPKLWFRYSSKCGISFQRTFCSPAPRTDPDEMIYDDVELGEEGGGNSSLDNGWSSSEFESYDEASDGEGRPENGMPHAFMRGKPPQRKTHVCTTSCPRSRTWHCFPLWGSVHATYSPVSTVFMYHVSVHWDKRQ